MCYFLFLAQNKLLVHVHVKSEMVPLVSSIQFGNENREQFAPAYPGVTIKTSFKRYLYSWVCFPNVSFPDL